MVEVKKDRSGYIWEICSSGKLLDLIMDSMWKLGREGVFMRDVRGIVIIGFDYIEVFDKRKIIR